MKPLPTIQASIAGADPSLPPCLDRRAFIANSGMLAVGAMLASACGDGQLGSKVTGPSGNNGTATVNPADYPALASIGGIARINGTTWPVAVVRASATSYKAFSMVCTHEGTTINIVNGNTSFLCPNHGAMYANTGQWTGGQVTSSLKELVVTPGTGSTFTVAY